MKIRILREEITFSHLKNLCILILIILFFFPVCTTINITEPLSARELRNINRQNLLRLHIGMTKEEVTQIMGTETISTPGEIISNPYRSEILQGKEKILEVWFYYTDVKKRDDAITDDELTPLIFDGEKLIGWGWSFFQEAVIKYEIRIR